MMTRLNTWDYMGGGAIRKGLWSYVNLRQKIADLRYARSSKETERFTPSEISPTARTRKPGAHQHHSNHALSRPQNHYTSRPRPRNIYRPAYLPAASEMEIWLPELSHDFLLEPTPFLVLCSTFHLGLVMNSSSIIRPYGIWRICSFNLYFGTTFLELSVLSFRYTLYCIFGAC